MRHCCCAEALQRVADRRVRQHGVERPGERTFGIRDAERVLRPQTFGD